MSIQIKSTEAQQNFGQLIEQAMLHGDVIVERYGEPRVAVIGYQRYQQLIALEQANQIYLQPPRQANALRENAPAYEAADVRQALHDVLEGSLEEVMASLRGRS